MRRENQIGRHQGRVLTILVTLHPRPVDARWLAYAADPGGDQTRGNRVLAALEARGLIERHTISRSVDQRAALKWALTDLGMDAWLAWLPAFVESAIVDVAPLRGRKFDAEGLEVSVSE